jgi:hypothetical protein
MGNDGNALVSNDGSGTGGNNVYMYSSSAGFVSLTPNIFVSPIVRLSADPHNGSPTLAASADRSVVLAAQSALSPPAAVL